MLGRMEQETNHQETDHVTPEVVGAEPAPEDGRAAPSVTEPSKLIRIASMTRAMLEEVRGATLDDAGKARLASIYDGSLEEPATKS